MDPVLLKVQELIARAKAKAKVMDASGETPVKFKLASNDTPLSRVIKTQEQADLFMRRLKALTLTL